jgi:hypothetical protein
MVTHVLVLFLPLHDCNMHCRVLFWFWMVTLYALYLIRIWGICTIISPSCFFCFEYVISHILIITFCWIHHLSRWNYDTITLRWHISVALINMNEWISLFHCAFWFIKFYSHQLMHFLIQLCISLLSCIKNTLGSTPTCFDLLWDHLQGVLYLFPCRYCWY